MLFTEESDLVSDDNASFMPNTDSILTSYELEFVSGCVNIIYEEFDDVKINKSLHFFKYLMIALNNIKNFNFAKFASKYIDKKSFDEFVNFDRIESKDLEIIKSILKDFSKINVDYVGVNNTVDYFIKLMEPSDGNEELFFRILAGINNSAAFKQFLNVVGLTYGAGINIPKYASIFGNIDLRRYIYTKSNIIHVDNGSAELSGEFAKIILQKRYKDYNEFIDNIIGPYILNFKTNLTKSNFLRYNKDFDKITDIINSKEVGINILINGVPGTGKSEFAKLLCKKNKYNTYFIGSDDDNNDRKSKFILFQDIIHNDNSVIIFDEAQDFFGNNFFQVDKAYRDYFNKHKVNELLENNRVPTIWITNDIRSMDPAYLRRFTYIVQMDENTNEERIKCINTILKRKKYEVDSLSKIINISNKYNLNYAYIDTYLNNMIKIKGSSDDYIEMVKNLANILEIPASENEVVENYDLSLINTDIDVKQLINTIRELPDKKITMLLYGVPGTGKSEFAKYLTNQINLNYINKSASDILGMYVGESEQNMKNAFKDANDRGYVLIMDEVDSFISSRSNARNSWEKTLANEMLVQMEKSSSPFIATTNLVKDLDEASFRRFDIKIKYNYMLLDQVIKAFKIFFNKDVKLDQINKLTRMTPGDFSCVKKELRFRPTEDINKIIEMLYKQQDYKNEGTTVGF